jgi:hypothetical protein
MPSPPIVDTRSGVRKLPAIPIRRNKHRFGTTIREKLGNRPRPRANAAVSDHVALLLRAVHKRVVEQGGAARVTLHARNAAVVCIGGARYDEEAVDRLGIGDDVAVDAGDDVVCVAGGVESRDGCEDGRSCREGGGCCGRGGGY